MVVALAEPDHVRAEPCDSSDRVRNGRDDVAGIVEQRCRVHAPSIQRPRFGACRNVVCLPLRSEEHTYELQSLMRISYAVFCLKKKNVNTHSLLISITNI